ncbi:iron ABC transporter permease [Candidatus Poribacteria bacterium]|nr:iron ABC transporter permease [Candidatus Poribacteria bacterium]MYG08623.1 iron ABC transporter permease [Candidatus Poribacteria bacterium]MYK22191.1 iron ABC transporter permease [Candidatus Poribacteria bacterium]
MQKVKTVRSHRYFSIPAGVAGIPIVLVGIGGLIPLVYLLTKAFSAEATALVEIVFRWRNARLFLNTLLLTAGVLSLDLLIATPAAWLTSRVNLKGKRYFTVLCALPLAIPGYVMAYALLALGGNTGIVAQLFGTSIPRLGGYWGALLALSAYTSPYLFLNLRTALLGLDPSLEESARSLGYRYYETFFRVILPQLRPAFYASGLLISLHVLGDFGVVSLMRYETFSYALYTEYTLSFEHIYAAWLALMLLAFTGCLLYLEAKLLNKVAFHRAGRGTSRQSSQVQLGAWRNPAYIFLSLLAFVTVVVPVGAILLWMFRGFNTSALASLSAALVGSLSIAIPAGMLCALLAVPFAYIDVRYPSRASKALARVAYIVYAIPPLAFALSLIFFVLNTVSFIYKTLPVLIYACTLHFLAEAIGPVRSSLYQASPNLEEAARSLGYPRIQAFFKTLFPILMRGMLTATALVFLATMKELPLTFLLSPAGYETLALNVWSYTTEAMFAEAAPYALAILIFSGVFVGVLIRQEEQT